LGDTETLARNLLHLDLLSRALACLDRLDIPCVVVKGAALLATAYQGDLALRPMEDVDLVLPHRALRRAVPGLSRALDLELVPDSGVELAPPAGRPGHHLTRLDLHHRLPWGGARAAHELLDRRRLVHLQHIDLPVPAAEDHMLLVATHATLWHVQLRPGQVEDLRRLAWLVDPAVLTRRAAANRVGWALHATVQEAGRLSGARELQILGRRLQPSRGGVQSYLSHLLRRRLALGPARGRAHLRYALLHRDLPETAAHLVRRAWMGAARAQLAEAGIR
jgi:hypothetical protein